MLRNRYLLALLSALLLWLGWPPVPGTSPLLLISLVPLLFAVEGLIQSDERRRGRKIFWLSFLAFAVWNTASVFWVFNSMNAVGMGWLAALLISLIPYTLAPLLMAGAMRLYAAMRFHGRPLWLCYTALVCFWLGYEYLNQHWDLAFPWMTLGNGFANSPALIQWYEYTGVFGGSLWILAVNILVVEAIKNFRNTAASFRLRIAAGAIILLPILISLIRYTAYKEEINPANVVVVQPNINPYARFSKGDAYRQIEVLTRLSDSAAQKNTEFFIWPETAITDGGEETQVRANPLYLQTQQFLQSYKNGNVLSGIESYLLYDTAKTVTARLVPGMNKYLDVFNAAVLIENSAKVQFYHKSKLVPGVEQIPFSTALSFLKPVFAKFGGSAGGYGGQEEPSVLYTQSGIGVVPVICYESLWGDWVGHAVKKGAQFIAIVTNDGWWGDTSGKDQHFDYARLRAIETRRWVVRSANTGISGFINQRGDIVSETAWWQPAALKADINLNEKLTFYVRTGDLLALLACFGSGVFGMMLALSRRSGKVPE